jgi:hypothetical protein
MTDHYRCSAKSCRKAPCPVCHARGPCAHCHNGGRKRGCKSLTVIPDEPIRQASEHQAHMGGWT